MKKELHCEIEAIETNERGKQPNKYETKQESKNGKEVIRALHDPRLLVQKRKKYKTSTTTHLYMVYVNYRPVSSSHT